MADLYEPCPLCGLFPGTCPGCAGSGFVPTGLKSGQAARLARLEAVIRERIWQHAEYLRLWESGALMPNEPDPDERERTRDRLRAALAELRDVLKLAGYTRLF